MNELNYASREASQRLVDRGIVLETEAVWICEFVFNRKSWRIVTRSQYEANSFLFDKYPIIPAAQFAEVWRELPLGARLYRGEVMSEAYMANRRHGLFLSENPTDALIDLLIWQKGERG